MRTLDAKTAIQNRFPLPERIETLRRLATADLWNGPLSNDEDAANYHGEGGFTYPGFVKACEELAQWADDNVPCQLWYDEDADCLSDCQPEAWQDEDGNWNEPEPARELSQVDICDALFGRKLSEYL